MNIKKINKKNNRKDIVIELIKRGYTFTQAIEMVGLKNESK